MKAYQLQEIDKERDMHLQAWLNHAVTSTKEVGGGKNVKHVPVYKEFKDFFDYEKRLREVEKPTKHITPEMRKMARVASKVNAGGR